MPAERPESPYESEAEVPICEPLRYILYPDTPTLSLEAVHDMEAVVWVTLESVGVPGTDGGVASEPPPPEEAGTISK